MFIATIGQLSRRGLVAELDEALAKVVSQVRVVGKPGKLTLELTIKPRNNEASEVDVIENVKITAPQQPRKGSIFFTGENGSLSRTDPSQSEIDFTAHDGGKADTTTTQAAPIAAAS